MSSPLVDAHARVHDWLEDALYRVLEALVAVDLRRAERALAEFAAVLDAHMHWEDAHALPVYQELAPKDGPGRADHVAGDHVILTRNLAAVRADLAALSGLEENLTLRHVLRVLPSTYRVLATLEHHTLREQNNVYPALERAFSAEALAAALATLRGLVDAPPSA